MKPKNWRSRYRHVPADFPRRVRVLQDMWGMNSADFGWRIGLNLDYIQRFRQGRARPTLEAVKKITAAAGKEAADYLLGRGVAPARPAEPLGFVQRDMSGIKIKADLPY